MDTTRQAVARRIVQGVGVQAGELIEVREDAGRPDILSEILLAIECAGATPLVQLASADYIQRLLTEAPVEYLAQWDQHRRDWIEQTSRVIAFQGNPLNLDAIPTAALQTWEDAVHRLTVREEARGLPFLLVAIPTDQRAQRLGLSTKALEEMVFPALAVSTADLQAEIERVLDIIRGGQTIIMESGKGYTLHLQHADRRWLWDDGYIDADDRRRGAVASNLPAGSIYTTVVEGETYGQLAVATMDTATDVLLSFEAGRVVRIDAASGSAALTSMFDRHAGEPRRVSHIGVGLNPLLSHPIGWTLVDEHVHGMLLIAFGENRYMGGHNESSLNVDYVIPDASLVVDGRSIVSAGKLVV